MNALAADLRNSHPRLDVQVSQRQHLPTAMSEESKFVDPEANRQAAKDVLGESVKGIRDPDSGDEIESTADKATDAVAADSATKKKKSKKAKLKKAFGVGHGSDADNEVSSNSSKATSKLTGDMVEQLLEMNPSLEGEVAGMSKDKRAQAVKQMDVSDLLTGMSVSGKNQKDMASYKFWQTQPVPRFDETRPRDTEDGPIKVIDPDSVPKEPKGILEGFVWVTMDLTNEKELVEVFELLTDHYVEDDEAMFRFNYSVSFLNWALKSPGWRKEWHIGVRATRSNKLVAFISGVPVALRVRSNTLKSTEINFLCVHKKLRSKRLAPVLIQEITRRCYRDGIFQAIYTGGVVLPTPVSTCRYFHRSLDWLKLYDVGFSPLPPNSTKARQITRNNLPNSTSTPGLRAMEGKDVPAVQKLLERYLTRFEMAPTFDREEVEHWLLHNDKVAEQVVWTYVVEDPSTHKITDFFSFYCLESSVINNKKYDNVKAAYLFYYASETAFAPEEQGLKDRLNALINDALILAKKYHFDVFNALTLLDNPLFLEQQKFGAGDGQLHFYLYNYRTAPIAGGVDAKNNVDASKRGGVGVVML